MQEELVSQLLYELTQKLKELYQKRKDKALTEAPNFSPFTYINPGENRLSAIIADFINPKGTHGQCDEFLKRFLSIADIGSIQGTEDAEVEIESQTHELNTKRRIDLVITGYDWIVGIENKPWASDQDEQVNEYLIELSKRADKLPNRANATKPRAVLLYLTRCGCRPSGCSISEEECESAISSGRLKLLSYDALSKWLEHCHSACKAERVQAFLADFRTYIHHSILGRQSNEEDKMIVELVFDSNHPEHLPAALKLIQRGDTIRNRLKDNLVDNLKRGIEAKMSSDFKECRFDKNLLRISYSSSTIAGFEFCVEKDGRGWAYGIRCNVDPEKRDEAQQKVFDDLKSKLKNAFPDSYSSHWWPFYRYFGNHGKHAPEEYLDWETSTQPWLDMHNGKMTENLLALAEELYTIIQSPGPVEKSTVTRLNNPSATQ